MKSFEQIRKCLIEQDVPKQKKPPVDLIPTSTPMQLSIDPLDLEVIYAFFRGEPDVVGTNIHTRQNDDGDYSVSDLRIDLLFGRAKRGLALMNDLDLITFAEPSVMIDDNQHVRLMQSIIKNMAKEKNIRTM